MFVATLQAPDDFAEWRNAARPFLANGIAPHDIDWQVGEAETPQLFATPPPALPSPQPALNVPRALLTKLRLALLHSDPARFALAYRLLYRMRDDPALPDNPADPDVIALSALAKSVRRDMHKMHAFVRFRKTGEANGREQFAAWFEPDHHITRAVAGFFRDRFAGMDWLIVTPQASIGWDGATLRSGPGGTPGDVPDADAVEAEWRAYYANIFNPARVKVAAMKKEMPVRYWRNLPEAMLIPPLLRRAGARVEAMVNAPQSATATLTVPTPARRFDSLADLYAALEREDVPPPGFSDRTVPGEGPAHARLMLIGEQPGDQEDRSGRPFTGPAGQLLDQCFTEAGIDRTAIYLANAVKRFKFTPRGKHRLHQTPNAGDIAHYRWWLQEEIRLVDPAIIVSLGATALHALTGKKQPLAPLRGTAFPSDGRQLFVTVHPSYLLRLPDAQGQAIERGKFIRDLAAANTLA